MHKFISGIAIFCKNLLFRHNETGPRERDLYARRAELLNKEAQHAGWPDAGFMDWFTDFAVPNMDEVFLQLWSEVRPLYVQLHAYVRYQLWKAYPDKIDLKNPIPAHLFGMTYI